MILLDWKTRHSSGHCGFLTSLNQEAMGVGLYKEESKMTTTQQKQEGL